ncbi:MAG: hypothetical protein QW734_02740 [Candidatus Bathyarchaeia archaeon]
MYFDIAMPLTLFATTTIAVLTFEKVEKKLKKAFEEKEFQVKDAILLVAMITATVSVMAFIPQMAIIILFLLAYSLLFFIFTYIFSDFKKALAKLVSEAFFAVSFLIATTSLFTLFPVNTLVAYGAAALYCLCGFSFIAAIYEEDRLHKGERWYLAAMPSTLFVLLYVFFNRTPLWFPYLQNVYGLIFAVLIVLYLGSLFTWKTSLVFAGLLTVADIVLVLVTGSMVSAATHVSGLRLPILVILPTLPQVVTEEGALFMSLGLGDFFFAGLLALQAYKKFGKNFAFLSSAAMASSFFIYEMFILNFGVRVFPGTLMIITGWTPVALLKYLKDRKVAKMGVEKL